MRRASGLRAIVINAFRFVLVRFLRIKYFSVELVRRRFQKMTTWVQSAVVMPMPELVQMNTHSLLTGEACQFTCLKFKCNDVPKQLDWFTFIAKANETTATVNAFSRRFNRRAVIMSQS